VTGVWFKPSAGPGCGPVTVAITLADGRVAKLRDDWC
jgi:hypothetical protein